MHAYSGSNTQSQLLQNEEITGGSQAAEAGNVRYVQITNTCRTEFKKEGRICSAEGAGIQAVQKEPLRSASCTDLGGAKNRSPALSLLGTLDVRDLLLPPFVILFLLCLKKLSN